jgi:hypothetical protein
VTEEKELRVASRSGLGAGLAAWGMLRRRPLLVVVGAAAFFADHRAAPVQRVLAALRHSRRSEG